MTTRFDNITTALAEGHGRSTTSTKNKVASEHTPQPLFQRFVVLDVIFDPQIINKKKIEFWRHELGVSNIEHAIVAPRNSIIAKRVQNNTSPAGTEALVLYPFFSSHLALPVSSGEHVWVMFEDPIGTKNDLGYWMSRIATAEFVEDVNHTHQHRLNDPSFFSTTKDAFDGNKTPKYEFHNGSVSQENDERYAVPETATAPGGADAYVKLMQESDAGKLAVYEPVPRFRKRPKDIVLEGSNNSLVVIGRDRSGQVAQYDELGTVSKPIDDVNVPGSGLIDLVVGRGQTPETLGNTVENSLENLEIDRNNVSEKEGDPDLSSDRTRVLLTQMTPIDVRLGISAFNREFSNGSIQGNPSSRASITDDLTKSPNGDGAAVVKSDKIRLIARSDIEILVTGFSRDENNRMVSADDESEYCAIVLKANGDIVLRPGSKGYIKLGGDDADKGLVCTDFPVTATDGVVSGQPIITTMGGQFAGALPTGTGNSPALAVGQGKFASKILVK